MYTFSISLFTASLETLFITCCNNYFMIMISVVNVDTFIN
nr:unnamed protein product [Callosobruchus chinensis]